MEKPKLNFITNYANGYICLTMNNDCYICFGDNPIYLYKPTSSSDDRLKENEELTQNACETSKTNKSYIFIAKHQRWKIMIRQLGMKKVG